MSVLSLIPALGVGTGGAGGGVRVGRLLRDAAGAWK